MYDQIIEYFWFNLNKNSPDSVRGVPFYLSFFTNTF